MSNGFDSPAIEQLRGNSDSRNTGASLFESAYSGLGQPQRTMAETPAMNQELARRQAMANLYQLAMLAQALELYSRNNNPNFAQTNFYNSGFSNMPVQPYYSSQFDNYPPGFSPGTNFNYNRDSAGPNSSLFDTSSSDSSSHPEPDKKPDDSHNRHKRRVPFSKALLKRINRLRKEKGLEPLEIDEELTARAKNHASTHRMKHSRDGTFENLASGPGLKSEKVMAMWTVEDAAWGYAHQRNLLNPKIRKVGIAKDGPLVVYKATA